jgi:hypothetical protein
MSDLPKQYDTIKLQRDLDPVIKAGMVGVILEIWDDDAFEVEFLINDGTNYEYIGQYIFTISSDDFKVV